MRIKPTIIHGWMSDVLLRAAAAAAAAAER
jgi:hypothetical protein